MTRVALVTDSAANLPADLRDRYAITVVPVYLYLDGVVIRDEVDMTTEEFYRWFRQNPEVATTSSCPPPGDFLAVYQGLAADHDAILSVHTAAALSGTHASALQAASLLDDVPVEVIDSTSVSLGTGFSVLAAARLLDQGADATEAAAEARRVAGRVDLFATLETLRYAVRTGRVPPIAAYAGSLLRVHPVLRIKDGHAALLRIERTMHRATERVVDAVVQRLEGRPAHVAVLHADSLAEAEALTRSLAARCDCRELVVTEFTPVMAANSGPGLLGVAFYAEG